MTDQTPHPPGANTPIVVTWIGHSTVLLDIDGVRVLTDPLLTDSVAHLRRHVPTVEPGEVDAIAISHVHMDHLHPRSVRRVTGAETELIVPTGAAALLRRVHAGRIHEVGVGDEVSIGEAGGVDETIDGLQMRVDRTQIRNPSPDTSDVVVEAVTAVHSDRRGPHTLHRAPALGFVVRAGGRRIYFAGDTGPFEGMTEVGPVDVALVPIWGWGASLGEHHLNPATAAEAVERVQAAQVIPIHWGTYSPRRGRSGPPPWFDRPLDEFRAALAARDLDDRLVALHPGESVTVPPRT